MQPRTSIYHKLILYIFFLGIFVIVTVSLYSFITARNAILQRTFDQLTSLKVAKKEQVEQFFKDRLKEVELFASQENQGIIRINTQKPEGQISFNTNKKGITANYQHFFKSGGYYTKVYLIYGEHFESYAMDSVSDNQIILNQDEKKYLEPVINRARKENQAIIEDYTFSFTDSICSLFIATPISGANQTESGIALFVLKPSVISNIMKNEEVVKSLGKSGEVYLVGPDSLMRSESRFFKNSILHLPVKTESVRKAYSSGEGSHLNKDYRGIITLSSYNRLNIPGLDWIIVAEMDKREAMRPVYKLANEIVFLSIFITLILFIFAYIISRTITKPIIELKNATIRVRNGDLASILHSKSNDELGELTVNFNLMTSQLKTQQEELKDREVRIFSSFIDGQEDERQRLSRELHDGLGQMIIATKLKTESIVNTGNGINIENISRLRLMYDSLVDEVRSISNNLMPAALQEFGLEIALKQICNEISSHSRIKVIFDSQISDRELDKRIAVYIFRIAQEALSNAVKHSGAGEIIMTLIGNEKMISLNVQDDGVGINMEENRDQNGRGINSMNERVRLLHGLMDISKGVNKGTIVSVKIPLM